MYITFHHFTDEDFSELISPISPYIFIYKMILAC